MRRARPAEGDPVNVLFIDPPWIVENDENLWQSVRSCLPGLGLAYVAACLEREGHGVSILDATALRMGVAAVEAHLRTISPAPDVVGLTATCATFPQALLVAASARRCFPGARIVMGGVHPSVAPEDALADPAVDVVVIGEGERTIVELAAGRPLDAVAGIAFRGEGGIVKTPPRPLIADLDEIPPPAYHLLPMDRYRPAVGSYRRLPAMSIFATRGCPGRCTFCHRTFGGKVRRRSARNIAAEVRLLHDRYGIREIAFYDDTFTVFEETVREFCAILKSEGPDVTWSCFTRVDHVKEDLLRTMRDAGCHLILFGVESADPEILKAIRKGISLDTVRRAVKIARRVGIATRASYMLGNPGETEETVKKTLRFARELDTDQAQFNITTAYPGTELYEWAREHGCLIEEKRLGASVSDVNLRLPTIAPETLMKYYRTAHRDYYLRPRIILRRVAALRSWTQLVQEVRGALAVLGLRKG